MEERSNVCMFFSFLQTFQPSGGGCTEKRSLSCPPPHPLPPAGLSQLQPSLVATAGENRKPQLCGTKQACIMFTQRQRPGPDSKRWGPLQQLRQPFHVQGCALEAKRAEKPLAVTASKSLISPGGLETGSELAKVAQRTEFWFGKRGREG